MYDPCMHSAGEGVNAIVRVLLSVAPLSRAHFIPLLCPPERAMLGGCTIDTLAFPPTPHSHSHLTWSPTAGVQSSMAWTACIYSEKSVPSVLVCKLTVYRLFENFGLAKLEHSPTELETRHKCPAWRCAVQSLTPGAHRGTEGRRGKAARAREGDSPRARARISRAVSVSVLFWSVVYALKNFVLVTDLYVSGGASIRKYIGEVESDAVHMDQQAVFARYK